MDDRELLELAAKAAGIEIIWNVMIDNHNPIIAPKNQHEKNWLGREHTIWNPLTDDGDALRLAVKLNLHIGIDAESAGSICVEWWFDEEGSSRRFIEHGAPIGGDDYAATRRAIVRAAAEIARSMK